MEGGGAAPLLSTDQSHVAMGVLHEASEWNQPRDHSMYSDDGPRLDCYNSTIDNCVCSIKCSPFIISASSTKVQMVGHTQRVEIQYVSCSDPAGKEQLAERFGGCNIESASEQLRDERRSTPYCRTPIQTCVIVCAQHIGTR